MTETSGVAADEAETTTGTAGQRISEERSLSSWAYLLNRFVGMLFYVKDIFSLFTNFWIALYLLKGNRWKYTKNIIAHQIIFSGIDALGLVGIVAAMVGGVVMVQVLSYTSAFETDAFLMQILVTLVVTELAPILTSLILVGRSGSAITVELGEMRIKRHHEALEAMGIDIFQYFHVPRLIGLPFSNVVMNAYFVFITLASALLISAFREGGRWAQMLEMMIESLSLTDISICIVKGFVLGMVVGCVSIHHGMMVKTSATEIPQQTSSAVINSFRLCFLINGFISFIWYVLR